MQPVSLSNSFFPENLCEHFPYLFGILQLNWDFHAHFIENLISACPTTRLIIFLGTHQQWSKQIYKNENSVEKSNNAHSSGLNPIILPYGNSSAEFVTFFRKLHHT